MIELRNITKVFKTLNGDIAALKDINLTIKDGEIFGIIGLSGAGKSTLVRCINLLEKPTLGEVLIDGCNLCEVSKKELLKIRRSIGMIFQGFNLLEQRNVLKNVCYPMEIAGINKKDAIERARELLELVGLSDREKSYPSQLSGGQKQRVAIARALATKPQYLLCDEATSALDPSTTEQILDLLKHINKTLGVTIIVITHEMKIVEKVCDMVAVIDKGQIAEKGNVKDVFSNPQSEIAKGLILPKRTVLPENRKNTIRIIFDGEKTIKPLISDMILSLKLPVNIMFADTTDIEGISRGHMILEIPENTEDSEKIFNWLEEKEITYYKEG
ncbi:MAG: ATP-binding cassette domain-containing protein [Clostridia bacterium]|nr:ATP-binding cassette domain-containing protein [Clostridia bacterium]